MKKYLATALAISLSASFAQAEEVKLIVKEFGSDKYTSIMVEESEVEAIKDSGQYASVEKEVWLKAPKPTAKREQSKDYMMTGRKGFVSAQSASSDTMNDPEYSWMYYWHDKASYPGSSEIMEAVNKSKQNQKLRIAVIDGGFEDHEDMEWNYGYNFFDEFGEVRGPEFRDLTDEDKMCTGGHGLGVASIIGAKQNNNIGIAGVVDAEMIAFRALSCGIGPLSDVADAIRIAAGGTVDGVPSIPKVDIINISMGGELDQCPKYFQSAVDFANSQGVKIFVAAGNQNVDANGVAPAQCEGIFVTGATNQDGHKTDFSNYGPRVDAMMAGFDIVAYSSNGVVGWWEGTSQASPLAASVAALGLQYNPNLTRDEIFGFLKATATPIREDSPNADQDCSGDRCGAGLINASKFMDYVIAASAGNLYFLNHALSAESTCSQELLTSSLGNALPLCQMYELTTGEAEGNTVNNYRVVKVTKGQSLVPANAELIIESTEAKLLLDSIDLESFDYGVQVCSGDECSSTPIVKINTSNAVSPAICN